MERYVGVYDFFKRFNSLTSDSDDPRDNYYYQAALRDVFWELEFTPTADVAEVKHGQWEYIGGYGYQYRCSSCIMCAPHKTKYCPHCGAKMDEVSE